MLDALEKKYGVNKQESIDHFWDIFVVDALIGNKDRHLGNWGFIKRNHLLEFAPVYDCGSSLSSMLTEEEQCFLLKNLNELKNVSYNIVSVYQFHGKRVFYYELFQNPVEDLKQAILRIVPKIDEHKIKDIIYHTEGLSDCQKEFYFKSIMIRKEMILDSAYQKIIKEKNTKK